MKLAATSLITYLTFTLVSTSPTPFGQDISTATTKTTWLVSKRAVKGWDTPDTLSKRFPTTAKPTPPVSESNLARRMFSSSKKPVKAAEPDRQPLVQPSSGTNPANANTLSNEPTKTGWMLGSKYHWSPDDETRKWAQNADVHKKFEWMKEKCHDRLRDRGCAGGTIAMVPYPKGEGSESHFADVSNLLPPIKNGVGTTDRALITPDGFVMPVGFLDKPRPPSGSRKPSSSTPSGYTPPAPTA